MKSESTIQRHMRQLRSFIDLHSDPVSNSRLQQTVNWAYDMETALQWVISTTSWTPNSLINEELNRISPNIKGKVV